MKLRKIILFILILPLTLFLDFIIYALVRTCPSCGSFTQFVTTEGAISFPLVIGIGEWIGQLIPSKVK